MQRSENGCLPCTNCVVTVPQDKWFAVQRFGSFYSVMGPGLSWVGPDCCGACYTLTSMSSRVEQLDVKVPTKTLDNVFVTVVVAVQFSVNPQSAQDAFFKLTDAHAQIDSFVSNIVRSEMPKLTVDGAFEEKDHMGTAVQEELSRNMADFGFQVHKALIIEIAVNPDVMRSMNEINKQKRLRDAAIMEAEAQKIRTVKAAEAESDAACLAGEGIARQRAAIVEGLRKSIGQTGRQVTTEDITELLLATQYFETLRDIGSHDNCKTYFMPEDSADLDSQVRQGMLEGQVALEYLGGASGYQPRPAPQQHTMSAHSPATQPEPLYQPPDPPRQNRPAYQQSYQPGAAAPAAPQQRTTLQVTVPQGVGGGQALQVRAPDGRLVQVVIPQGVGPGQMIQIQV